MKNWLLLKKFQLKLEEFDSSETVLLTLLQNWNYTDLISSKMSCTLFPLKHLYFQNCSNFFIFLQHVCALFCLAFINTCCYDHLFFFFIWSTFICITFEFNATRSFNFLYRWNFIECRSLKVLKLYKSHFPENWIWIMFLLYHVSFFSWVWDFIASLETSKSYQKNKMSWSVD